MRKVCVGLLLFLAVIQSTGHARAQAYLETDETLVRGLVNAARAGKGLGQLDLDPALREMARGQAVRMADRDDIYHNPNLGAEATDDGLAWLRIGENVGVGGDVEAIEQAFMESPHHRDNILYPGYNAVGVGVVAGAGGRIFVAQVFAVLKTVAAAPPVAPARQPAVTSRPTAPVPATAVPTAPTRPPARAATAAPRPPPSARPVASVGGIIEEGSDPPRPAPPPPMTDAPPSSRGLLHRVLDALVFWA